MNHFNHQNTIQVEEKEIGNAVSDLTYFIVDMYRN